MHKLVTVLVLIATAPVAVRVPVAAELRSVGTLSNPSAVGISGADAAVVLVGGMGGGGTGGGGMGGGCMTGGGMGGGGKRGGRWHDRLWGHAQHRRWSTEWRRRHEWWRRAAYAVLPLCHAERPMHGELLPGLA